MRSLIFVLQIYGRHFRAWWELNPSLTRFLPRWLNRILQKRGERQRSEKAQQESELVLPFPYNDELALQAYCLNRKFAEPDFEPYWEAQQRLMDTIYRYRKLPGPQFEVELTCDDA